MRSLRPSYWLWQLRKWLVSRLFVVEGRRRRYLDFVSLCELKPSHRVVNVGSGGSGASGTLARFNSENEIVALDLGVNGAVKLRSNVRFVQGDATAMPFEDNEYDIAFCNSLVEHLTPQQRCHLASEICRVAPAYWVQTPNRYFPIEPHQLVPFYQFLPSKLRRPLDDKLTGGNYTELLTLCDLQALFPDASIYRERTWGLTKSLVAYKPIPQQSYAPY